eukprot:CAMPEP_0195027782 /NCGR_PEP_ID=MMETSP0326_2-20130528/53031_1 /TAXON_ID=2866 ORGANISM="Crypthecodinium cohnii, Strain Seligo" /NCGR_SAMPLE_ID=MMETSP0326_2 /ASSEMBLY_ACC=CAM_ASM_000348 /LENGTH=48 /DNA_ID= /DNA_START= /DNA_END= /DNA_ORIENTATION=
MKLFAYIVDSSLLAYLGSSGFTSVHRPESSSSSKYQDLTNWSHWKILV